MSRVKKTSKLSIAKTQRKLWVLCKLLIRKKYQNPNGTWNCYTCDKLITYGRDAHTAHLIPKSACGAYLKYDTRNLRVCCYHCNINLGGNGAEFLRKMIIREGQSYVDNIFEDKKEIIKGHDHYLMLTEKYQLELEGLER